MNACGGYDHRSGRACANDAEQTITAGCVHEHIGDRDLCADHLDDLHSGWMYCGDCAAIDGHDCQLRVLERSKR